MRITEGQLRRIIRQEVRALKENFSPAAIAALNNYGISSEDWDMWEEDGDVVYGPHGQQIDVYGDGQEIGMQAGDPDERYRRSRY